MATKLDRLTLYNSFRDGARPTSDDFAGAWMSFLNQNDDQIAYNEINNNIVLGASTGLVLGNPTAGATAGTLRFNSGTNTVQFYDGAVFKDIAGSAGAFVNVGAGPAVAFSGGNVGIGAFPAASPPTHRLEIQLAAHTGAEATAQEISLGNLVIHNGPANNEAYIAHTSMALNDAGFALLQDNVGNTTINAVAGGTLALSIGKTPLLTIISLGLPTVPFLTSMASNLTIGGNSSPSDNRDLTVFGKTFNLSTTWSQASDARIKKDIKAYKEGLDKIIQLKPIIYKYNGKGGSFDDGKDYIGLLAQDLQKVAPEMVFSKLVKLNPADEKEIELLNYDFHNVLFMFINAFKELNARVEKLEKSKRNEKRKTGNSPGTDH